MDISNLTTSYLDQVSSATDNVSSSQMKNLVNKDYTNATDAELMDACKQFESYLMEQVFKEMKETTTLFSDEEESSNSSMVDYFMDSTIQDISETATEKEGLGIAQTLYEAMKREYNI